MNVRKSGCEYSTLDHIAGKQRISKWVGMTDFTFLFILGSFLAMGRQFAHHFSNYIKDLFFISFKHSIISFVHTDHSYHISALSEVCFLLDQQHSYQIKRVSLLFILLHLFSSLFCKSVKKNGIVHIKMGKWRDKKAKGLFGISNLVAKPSGPRCSDIRVTEAAA